MYKKSLIKIRNRQTKQHLEHKIIEIETAIWKEDKAVLNIQKNSKYFFQFAPQCAVITTKIVPLKVGDEIISDPSQISETLQSHYKTVFATEHQTRDLEEYVPTVRPISLLTNLEIAQELVSGAIKDLKPNCAAGPDDIW